MIEAGLPREWPAAVVDTVGRFDQGDLVERPPLVYAARPSCGVWSTTRLLAADVDDNEDIVIEVDPEDRPPFGIITSQGCDIADATRKPWVQVAPVYDAAGAASSEARLADIRRESVPHLALLSPPDIDGLWVADLRLEIAIEKSWLAGREPISGFATEEERANFSRRLAGRLQRPALPDPVHDAVVRPLRRWLDRAGTGLRIALGEARIEFRLLVGPADPTGSQPCRLLVIARGGRVPESVIQSLDRWWSRLSEGDSPDVVLLGCRYCTSDEITARDYLASVLLDDRFLGPDADVA